MYEQRQNQYHDHYHEYHRHHHHHHHHNSHHHGHQHYHQQHQYQQWWFNISIPGRDVHSRRRCDGGETRNYHTSARSGNFFLIHDIIINANAIIITKRSVPEITRYIHDVIHPQNLHFLPSENISNNSVVMGWNKFWGLHDLDFAPSFNFISKYFKPWYSHCICPLSFPPICFSSGLSLFFTIYSLFTFQTTTPVGPTTTETKVLASTASAWKSS